MLKVQTVALDCPKRGKVTYQLSIALDDFSPDIHDVSVIDAAGQEVPHVSTEEGVRFERSDPPGVWRFQAAVRDRSSNADARDALTIEVIVFPETEAAVRDAVAKTVSGMKVEIMGPMYHASDPAPEASRLQRSFGDMPAVEVLRHLEFDRGDTKAVLPSLLLLRALIGRPAAQWLPPMVFAVGSDLAGGISHAGTADCLLDVFERLSLPVQDKWFYLMRAAQDLQRERGRVYTLLGKITPDEFRARTAAIVLETCGMVVDGRREACGLFHEFRYAPAAPQVLEWMEADPGVIEAGCSFLKGVEYTSAAAKLRSLLERSGSNSGCVAIAGLLAIWRDREAVPGILKKLASIDIVYAPDLARALLRFGVEVVPDIQGVQRRSAPDRATVIQQVLAEK